MPSLIQRFQNLFWGTSNPESQTVTTAIPPSRPLAEYALFEVETSRRAAVVDCRRMVEDDPRAESVIDSLASDIVKGGFELQVEGPRAEEALTIATEMLERVDFWKKIDDWVRLTLRDGDSFLELEADSQGWVNRITRKPTLEMHRWSDDFDQFYDPMKAFWWADLTWSNYQPPTNATFFAEWQIVHGRFRHDENNRYGRPLFASARKAYKRMTEGETDLAVRRKTRAGMKYSHVLEDASEADLNDYIERNKSVLNNPFAAVADFFSSKRTTVSAIQGDATLGDINDIVHHIRTWWIASPVPMSLVGYGQDLNRDVLDEQKEQYDSTKEELSNWAAEQFVAPIIERQWLLRGIWPETLTWSPMWAGKQALTAPDLESAGRALAIISALGLFSDETLLRFFAKFVPEFDVEAELAELEQRQAEAEALALQIAQGAGGALNPDQNQDQNDRGNSTNGTEPNAQ